MRLSSDTWQPIVGSSCHSPLKATYYVRDLAYMLLLLASLVVSACQNSPSTSKTTEDQKDTESTSSSQANIDKQLLTAATSLIITATDAEGPITTLLQKLAVKHKAQLRRLVYITPQHAT